MAHRIAVIGGDGIGPEVTAEALKVVRAAGVQIDTVDFDLGGARYLRGSDVERLHREVRVQAIGGGSEEIMRDLASRQLGI